MPAHKGQKLGRWMNPPTAIAAIASFHVHAVLHIIHLPCICVQQPASTSKREALDSPPATGNQPNQAPLCRVLPRAQTPTQRHAERRSINTHAAAKRMPPRCMHHLPLVTAHTVRSHRGHAGTHSAPVSVQVHTDIKNVQSHLFTGREGAAVPAGGQGEEGGGGDRSAVAARTELSGYRGGTYVPKTLWIPQNHYQPKPVHTCGAPKHPRAKAFAAGQRGIAPPKTETLAQCPDKSQLPLTRENESKVSGHLQGHGHSSTGSSPGHHLGTYTPSRWRPSTSCNPRKRKVPNTKQIYPILRE